MRVVLHCSLWLRGSGLRCMACKHGGEPGVSALHACLPRSHTHTPTHPRPPRVQVKRLIKGGGVYLNNTKVTDQDRVLTAADLIDGKLLLLAAGKKNKMLVRIGQ